MLTPDVRSLGAQAGILEGNGRGIDRARAADATFEAFRSDARSRVGAGLRFRYARGLVVDSHASAQRLARRPIQCIPSTTTGGRRSRRTCACVSDKICSSDRVARAHRGAAAPRNRLAGTNDDEFAWRERAAGSARRESAFREPCEVCSPRERGERIGGRA
jgi:hypothetical protein